MTEKITVTMRVSVHPIKANLWHQGISGKIKPDMSLRQIGKLIGEERPQIIQHHLQKMVAMGAIDIVCGQYIFPKLGGKALKPLKSKGKSEAKPL